MDVITAVKLTTPAPDLAGLMLQRQAADHAGDLRLICAGAGLFWLVVHVYRVWQMNGQRVRPVLQIFSHHIFFSRQNSNWKMAMIGLVATLVLGIVFVFNEFVICCAVNYLGMSSLSASC